MVFELINMYNLEVFQIKMLCYSSWLKYYILKCMRLKRRLYILNNSNKNQLNGIAKGSMKNNLVLQRITLFWNYLTACILRNVRKIATFYYHIEKWELEIHLLLRNEKKCLNQPYIITARVTFSKRFVYKSRLWCSEVHLRWNTFVNMYSNVHHLHENWRTSKFLVLLFSISCVPYKRNFSMMLRCSFFKENERNWSNVPWFVEHHRGYPFGTRVFFLNTVGIMEHGGGYPCRTRLTFTNTVGIISMDPPTEQG